MRSTPTRATDGAIPPSTDGTSEGRARRWPLGAGILAMAAIAVAAPMVAAEPASAPVQPTAVAAVAADAVIETTTTTEAGPTQAEIDELNEALWVHRTNEQAWIDKTNERILAEELARQQAEAEAAAAAAAAAEQARKEAAAAAAPAPSAGSGRCGGNLPPCYIMNRESGGNIRAKNPSSTASGKWQFLNSTWAGYGGYAEAWMAPESVQDAKAAQLWAGGAGCGHWSAC